MRKNKNRGFQKLRVWQDAIEYYKHTYKLENGLIKLIESIEQKRDRGEWVDHLNVKETNALYGIE